MQSKKIIETKIVQIDNLATDVYSLVVEDHELVKDAKPGQFVNLYTNDKSLLLPRPISICDVEGDRLRLVYKVVGQGTRLFSQMQVGDMIRVSTPLGNGYDLVKLAKYDHVNVVGGGIGVPPMIYLAKALRKLGVKVTAIFGYQDEPFLDHDLDECGVVTHVATDSGRFGFKGNALQCIKEEKLDADYYCACGPKIMLKFLCQYVEENGQEAMVSMEERMGCGYGACVGCVTDIKEADGSIKRKKVCKDGPVFTSKEVVF